MAFKCKIGLHNWNGCKCLDCGKTRDEQHNWNGCKCSKCTQVRDEQHDFSKDCEKCSKCGKTRKNQHKWDGRKCTICGKLDKIKCDKCGQMTTEFFLVLDPNNFNNNGRYCPSCANKFKNSHDCY